MIRVIVERHLKDGHDIGRLLLDLHSIAFLQKGHISNETLMNVRNNNIVTIVSTWQNLEDWDVWESSKERAKILDEIEPMLAGETQVKIYEIVSPSDFDYFVDPVGWVQGHERPHFEG